MSFSLNNFGDVFGSIERRGKRKGDQKRRLIALWGGLD